MFAASKTASVSGGYQISRSLRFNSADSAYLNRTPASAGNRKTWTWSGWVKKSVNALADYQYLLSSRTLSTDNSSISFYPTTDAFRFGGANSGNTIELLTTSVYRDVSAWYHLVVAMDTTQATASDRLKMYVNGVQVTAFSTATYPVQNAELSINSTTSQQIGSYNGSATFSGYLTEVNFIDGQALTPSSFGETNAQTGVWQPKAYSGSYGTNGFYLNFSDNSNTTAATLGKDYSGNGNNWTPNNFSVTAGAGNDSLVDSPTSYGTDTGVGGTVRGNYCTLNPLTTTSGTYAQGNLQYAGANSWRRSNATISRATGQWYWEVTLANAPYPIRANGEWNAFGFGLSTVFNSTATPPLETDAVILTDSGYYKNFSGSYTDTGVAFASGDVLSIAVDLDANTFTFRRNNTSLATGTIGGTAGRELVPIILSYSNAYGLMDCNFGQRPFAYTAPSGYKALCTQNLPTPTIGATTATQAGKYFNPVLYTGNGGTQSVTGVGFQPDFVWVKNRSAANGHGFEDVLRGAGYTLASDSTSAEINYSNYFTAFTSDGFNMALGGGTFNGSGSNYVAWNWKANGSGSTNTAGSITSTVSANTTSGFSVVTWTGNATDNASVGHGLGVAPKMVIIKNRSVSAGWPVYTNVIDGSMDALYLNLTDAKVDTGRNQFTSSVFYVSSGTDTNGSGNSLVAYCFAEVAGYSKFGSYTGNGSADGTFIYMGFRPAYVLIKRTDTGGYDWWIMDATRSPANAVRARLYANTSDAEVANDDRIDFVSNGIKLRNAELGFNANGGTYIYACFATNPFKYSLAR